MTPTEERIIQRWLNAKTRSASRSPKRRKLVEDNLIQLSSILTPEAYVSKIHWFDSPKELPTPKNPGPVGAKVRQLLKDVSTARLVDVKAKIQAYTRSQRTNFYPAFEWYPKRLRQTEGVFFGSSYAIPLMCLELTSDGQGFQTDLDTSAIPQILTLAENVGWWYFEDRAFWVCDLPLKLGIDEAYNIHCATGPAVRWRDGYEWYIIEGRKVPSQVVLWDESDRRFKDLYFNEPNTEIRSVIMNKVGAARLLQGCNSIVMDEFESGVGGSYQLLGVDLGDDMINRTYLKMTNQSTGTYHMEAVPPHIQTVKQALNWRNGITDEVLIEPKMLT